MTFRALHRPGAPLVMPNAWDAGSARVLEGLGFKAVASTSAGAAFSNGCSEGMLSPNDLVAAAADLAQMVTCPVSADLENCGAGPKDIADTIGAAIGAGLAGGSIEDFSGDPSAPIYPLDIAVERVSVAVSAARAASPEFVLTARAEGLLHGGDDLGEILTRLAAYAEAGADVVYAPGLSTIDQVRAVCDAVPVPVNILVGSPTTEFTVETLAKAGAARISVGSALSRMAFGGLIRFGRTLHSDGVFAFDALAGFDEIEMLLRR